MIVPPSYLITHGNNVTTSLPLPPSVLLWYSNTPSLCTSLLPITTSIMSFPSHSLVCLRCTSLCLQCTTAPLLSRTKALCNQCSAAGIDHCFFPSAIRDILPRCNSRCISCLNNNSKCVFSDPFDMQCIRCMKQHLQCVFTLNGEYYLSISI